MSKRTLNKDMKQTPKAQKLKQIIANTQVNPSSLPKKNNKRNIKQKADINQNQKQYMKPQQNNTQQLSKQVSLISPIAITKSQLKKKVSINSQNFVMCKNSDFQNDYAIVDKLGQGSFGTVFRVKHRILGLDRALKKIKKNPTSKFSNFEEIEILRKLDHANILKIYQFYQNDDYYMIVTEIFQGKQLFDEIIQSQKFNEETASRIIRQILVTLNYTHSLGIAHRDIKPQNILIKNINDKQKLKIKLIDWGLGTLLLEQFTDRVCGTPQYAAPQIFQGKYSLLCDMWSLGVLTFVMLTGNMPFKGTNTVDTIGQVKRCIINYRKSGFNNLSPNAKQFITNLIQKDISRRMSAIKALQHPWITAHHTLNKQPVCLKQTLQRLKILNIQNQFGVAVVNLINNHFSSTEEKQKLEEIFNFLDTNGDGVLSKEQLIEGYGKIYGKELAQKIARETFAKLDVNNSGTLQYSQFIAYGLRRQKQKERQKLRQVFNLFDSDRNGSISWREVARILEGKLQGLYEEQMNVILAELDKNKDSEINFEEFYKFMGNLLDKVQVMRSSIRESKRRQSQIKSDKQKSQLISQTMHLKRTQSVDEPLHEIVQQKAKSPQKNNEIQKPRTRRTKKK